MIEENAKTDNLTVDERVRKVAEKWFLTEQALFAIYCTHELKANKECKTPFRVGKGRLEYNPDLVGGMDYSEIEENMRVEAIRIFLKHPYSRQPDGASKAAMALGSDCTIEDCYKNMKHANLINAEFFMLNKNESYEYYVRQIDKKLPKSPMSQIPSSQGESVSNGNQQSSKGGKGESDKSNKSNKKLSKEDLENKANQSDLWEEDELMTTTINNTINNIKNWGSIPGNIVEKIIASTKATIDYRHVLQGFRASVLSSHRNLTRMRPNRRTGFQNMGSVYKFRTKLLVAVDVSGSVCSDSLSNFYGIINKFFKYGVEQIDCVQFDWEMREVEDFKKAKTHIDVKGRGGTCFQPVIDYASKQKYDGIVILTDGYATPPVMPKSFHGNVLWVLEDEGSYNAHKDWMKKLGRVCHVRLDC